jgi:signal transduction histidine kinase
MVPQELVTIFLVASFSGAILFLIIYYILSQYRRNRELKAKILDLSNHGNKAVASLWKVNKAILTTLDVDDLSEKVVNVVLKELDYLKIGYRISVLTLIDHKKKVIRRVSFSPTPEALEILKEAKVRFHTIEIPLNASQNLLVKAVKHKKEYITHDLSDLFYPEKTRDMWRGLQQQVGIKTSLVYPLIIKDKSIGAMIFSLTKDEQEISEYEKSILSGFTDAVAVALEHASLYRRLDEANKALKDLDKRKDEFISLAAHDLRAPLTAVKGYLSMIVEGDAGKIPKRAEEFIQGALEGAEREIRLVNNMLNVSRIEENRLVFQMGTVNLVKVVKEGFAEFETVAKEKGLTYKLNIHADVCDTVYVDHDRIYEVVANLISNAVKYTDTGGVMVELSNPSKDHILCSIIDNGRGMAEEECKKLFTKFYRAESSAGTTIGTGLGLYIAKLLVEKFGGTIGVESELGKGSRFWFELPVKSK